MNKSGNSYLEISFTLTFIALIVVSFIYYAFAIYDSYTGVPHNMLVTNIDVSDTLQTGYIEIDVYQSEERFSIEDKYAVIERGLHHQSYIKEWVSYKPKNKGEYFDNTYPTKYKLKTKVTDEKFKLLKILADELHDYEVSIRVYNGVYEQTEFYVVDVEGEQSIEDYLDNTTKS